MIRELEVIGEASRGVSQAFRTQHPEIPWSEIAGMRNRIAHGYFEVDLRIVWRTAKLDLPPLKGQLRRILEERESY